MVLPGEARRGVRHPLAQGVGQVDLSAAGGDLGPMPPGNLADLRPEPVAHPHREQGGTVVRAFATAERDLAAVQVHVLDPEGDTLQKRGPQQRRTSR